MNDLPFQIFSVLSVLAVTFSIFSFCICLYVAKTLGKRLKRESLFGEIIGLYCEIREFNTRSKTFLRKISSTIHYRLLGSLPTDLEKVYTDTNLVFLEAFGNADHKKLLETKAALTAISSRLHHIMTNIELRLQRVKYY